MDTDAPGLVDLRVTADGGWARGARVLDRRQLLRALFDMHVVRAFEIELHASAERGEVSGPVHSALGQEGVPAALVHQLAPGDEVVGTHRSHHHFLLQGLARTLGTHWDPLSGQCTDAVAGFLRRAFAEVLGLPTGPSEGVGGSMHLRDATVGFMGSSAIVGGGLPLAAGLALAQRGRGGAVVCFIGDGAVNQGTFHETANLAGLLRLPLLVVVENNGYAECTRPEEATAYLPLADKARVHGVSGSTVDGADFVAVHEAFGRALAGVRAGQPSLVEVTTYRNHDHVGGRPGSAAGYRSLDEEASWVEREPVASLPPLLQRLQLATPGQCDEVRRLASDVVARSRASVVSGGARPVLDTARLLRAPAGASAAAATPRLEVPRGPRRTWTFRHAVARGLASALADRREVLFLGEEVGKPGGVLSQEGCLDAALLGTQVLDMPISEASFVGMAGGAAMAGMRPVVELMYGSFVLIAADQLFNHIGIMRALYGNTASAPVVVRTKVPVGLGYGPQHGLNPVGLFSAFPGWRVHAPADPAEYLGVLNSALRCEDPVLLVEFSSLHGRSFDLDDRDLRAELPLEGARVLRAGTDVTLISYGLGVHWALEAAEQLAGRGCSAEVLDLRALDLLSLDRPALETSLSRTGRGLFVEPAARSQTIAPRILAELVDGPASEAQVAVLACADVQPVAAALERQATIGADDVVAAVERMLSRTAHGR